MPGDKPVKWSEFEKWVKDVEQRFSSLRLGGFAQSIVHNILSTEHGDSQTDAASRGDLIIGQLVSGAIKWSRKAIGSVRKYARSDGVDCDWSYILGEDMPMSSFVCDDDEIVCDGDEPLYD